MKGILLVSSLIAVSIASIFTQKEINVGFKLPEKVIAGESFILEVEIDKGDVPSYSKLQLNLPEGFSAEMIDGKSGTFTFFDQKLKLIWIALPAEPKFTVSFNINVDESKSGTFNFDGKISYVVGDSRNEKKLITPNFQVTSNTAPDTQQQQQQQQQASEEEKNDAATPTTSVNSDLANQTSSLTCERKFDVNEVAPGESFIVTLNVNKQGVSGLGKIIENIPEGFSASEMKSNGAIFSANTDNNQVKLLWMTLPSEENFNVSYKVTVDQNLGGNKVIDGKMSYLDGDETKTTLINGTNISISNSPSSPDTPIESTQQTNATVNDQTSSDPVDDNVVIETPEVEPLQNTNTQPINNNEQVQKGNVNYRVQICATRKQVNTSYFVQKHQINEHIFANMHEGWHKYTVGDFNAYKGARDHREIIKSTHKIKGPFVTAYNNGNRITVQDALMITNDQWVQ